MIPVCIAYEERQVGDLIYIVTRDRVPIPIGWTNLTQNRDTNPHVEAYRFMQPGDSDVAQVWNFDLDDPKSFGVMVFRHVSPITANSTWLGTTTGDSNARP